MARTSGPEAFLLKVQKKLQGPIIPQLPSTFKGLPSFLTVEAKHHNTKNCHKQKPLRAESPSKISSKTKPRPSSPPAARWGPWQGFSPIPRVSPSEPGLSEFSFTAFTSESRSRPPKSGQTRWASQLKEFPMPVFPPLIPPSVVDIVVAAGVLTSSGSTSQWDNNSSWRVLSHLQGSAPCSCLCPSVSLAQKTAKR